MGIKHGKDLEHGKEDYYLEHGVVREIVKVMAKVTGKVVVI